MNEELERYKNFKLSEGELVKPALIQKLQERNAQARMKVFDADVVSWLLTQDAETQQRINDVIRHFMAVKTTP